MGRTARLTKRGVVLALVAMVLAGPPAFAKTPRESYCTLIRKTEDGKFRKESRFGWSLLTAEAEPGQIAFDSDVVGVTCLRDPPLTVPEDAEALRLGLSLYFANPKTGTTVKYELKEGRIVYTVTVGGLSESELKQVAKAASQVEARL